MRNRTAQEVPELAISLAAASEEKAEPTWKDLLLGWTLRQLIFKDGISLKASSSIRFYGHIWMARGMEAIGKDSSDDTSDEPLTSNCWTAELVLGLQRTGCCGKVESLA